MSNYLQTIIERTISFDIDMLLILIGNSKYLVCVIRVFACSVYLQFYAKVALAVTVKYGFRLVAVVMDTSAFVHFVMVAVAAIIITIEMISIVLMEQGIATAATSIMVVITAATKRSVIIAVRITGPYYPSTPVTGSSMILNTVSADYISIDSSIVFVFINDCSAVGAIEDVVFVFFHC